MIFGWDDAIGAVLSGVSAGIGASKEKAAYENFHLRKPQYEGIADAQQDFASQIGKLPQVAELLGKSSDIDNEAVQKRILSDDPNAGTNTTKVSELAYTRSQGGLNQDTVDAIKRANAYAAIQGGFAGSSMQGKANDLKVARARMGAQAQAPGLNSQALGMAQDLSPVNPDVAQTLIDPSSILKRDDQEENYNNDIVNQNRLADLAAATGNAKAGASGVTSGIAGLTGGSSGGSSSGGASWGGFSDLMSGALGSSSFI